MHSHRFVCEMKTSAEPPHLSGELFVHTRSILCFHRAADSCPWSCTGSGILSSAVTWSPSLQHPVHLLILLHRSGNSIKRWTRVRDSCSCVPSLALPANWFWVAGLKRAHLKWSNLRFGVWFGKRILISTFTSCEYNNCSIYGFNVPSCAAWYCRGAIYCRCIVSASTSQSLKQFSINSTTQISEVTVMNVFY